MDYNLVLDIAKIVEAFCLVLLIGCIFFSLKHVFDEEEVDLGASLKEFVYSSITLLIFIFISSGSIQFQTFLIAFSSGVFLGFISGFGMKIFKNNTIWFTKGSFLFLIMWALVLLISEVSEYIMEEVEWWWIFLAIFSVAMILGKTINIYVRKNLLTKIN